MNKLLQKTTSVLSVIMILTLCCFNGLINGVHFTGVMMLIILCMLLNPVLNLYRLNKKIINNKVYYLIVLLFSLFAISIVIISIFKYYMEYSLDFGNDASLYFNNYLVYMIVIVLAINLISLFIRKEKKQTEKDNSRIIFIAIALTSFFPYLNDVTTMILVMGLGLSIFSIIMVFKVNDLNTKSDLQKLYLVMIILSILTNNFVAIILIFNMYLQLDKFGLNV